MSAETAVEKLLLQLFIKVDFLLNQNDRTDFSDLTHELLTDVCLFFVSR